MKVHEVVDDSALKIVLDAVDDDALANVHDLQIGKVALVLIPIDCHVDLFILLDAVPKVFNSLLRIGACVIGRSGLDVENVCHDDVLVVAKRLYKECFNALLVIPVLDPASAGFGAVGGIQNGYDTLAVLEVCDHVLNGSFGGNLPDTLSFRIAKIEKLCIGMWDELATVGAHVEDFGINRQPLEVTNG